MKNDMRIKLSKYAFEVQKIKFLEYIISSEQMKMNSKKIRVIVEKSISKTSKKVQDFLELTELYQKIIEEYSNLILSLFDLLKKTAKWQWEKNHQELFEKCKKTFTTESVLRNFDSVEKIIMKTDASDEVIEECLIQKERDDQRHLVTHCSRKLQSAEVNYDVPDKRMLAIIYCLKEWRLYLQETTQKFKIYTNHHNLIYFTTIKALIRR